MKRMNYGQFLTTCIILGTIYPHGEVDAEAVYKECASKLPWWRKIFYPRLTDDEKQEAYFDAMMKSTPDTPVGAQEGM